MFLTKGLKIFESLVEQISVVEKAALAFQKMTYDWKKLKKTTANLKALETKADKIVHTIVEELEKTFILPFDKEDLEELTERLDDVIDGIEEVGNRLHIYKIPKSNASLKDFSKIILKAVQQIQRGVSIIKQAKITSKDFVLCYKNLHHLENQGDKLHRKFLADLMNGDSVDLKKNSFLAVLKWKEIFQTLENTLDKCEDIAILFERIRIKYR